MINNGVKVSLGLWLDVRAIKWYVHRLIAHRIATPPTQQLTDTAVQDADIASSQSAALDLYPAAHTKYGTRHCESLLWSRRRVGSGRCLLMSIWTFHKASFSQRHSSKPSQAPSVTAVLCDFLDLYSAFASCSVMYVLRGSTACACQSSTVYVYV